MILTPSRKKSKMDYGKIYWFLTLSEILCINKIKGFKENIPVDQALGQKTESNIPYKTKNEQQESMFCDRTARNY